MLFGHPISDDSNNSFFYQNVVEQLKSLGKVKRLKLYDSNLYAHNAKCLTLDDILFAETFETNLEKFSQVFIAVDDDFNWYERKANHRQKTLKALKADFKQLYHSFRVTRNQSVLFRLYFTIIKIKESINQLYNTGRKIISHFKFILKKSYKSRDIRKNIRLAVRRHFKNMSDCSGADNAVSFSTDVIINSSNNLLYETKQRCSYCSDRKMYKLYTAIAA